MTGSEIREIQIETRYAAVRPKTDAACFVVDARRLAGSEDLFAYTVLTAIPRRRATVSAVVVRLTDPLELLRHGQWVLPGYGGRGGWSSPWWETADPSRSTVVLHVEEDRD